MITERLLTCKQAVPGFLRRIFGSARDEADVAYALEISELDPVKRTYVARSVNLNFRHLVKVDEELTLDEDPEDVMRTRMKQSVEVTAIGTLARLGRMAEDALGSLILFHLLLCSLLTSSSFITVGKYKANAGSGKQALSSVLDMILDEARELATPSTA